MPCSTIYCFIADASVTLVARALPAGNHADRRGVLRHIFDGGVESVFEHPGHLVPVYCRAEHDDGVRIDIVSFARGADHEKPADEEYADGDRVAKSDQPLEKQQKALLHLRQHQREKHERHAEKRGQYHTEVKIGERGYDQCLHDQHHAGYEEHLPQRGKTRAPVCARCGSRRAARL